MPDRRLVVRATVAVALFAAAVGGATLVRRSMVDPHAEVAQDSIAPPARPPGPTGLLPAGQPQGLGCIHGGTTREEVRAIMGEPDSVAFGDWIYGRSSVTFGYGVALDYSNASGNLVICP